MKLKFKKGDLVCYSEWYIYKVINVKVRGNKIYYTILAMDNGVVANVSRYILEKYSRRKK